MKKNICLLLCLVVLGIEQSKADVISLRRRTATTEISFEGISNLGTYRLYRVYYSFHGNDTLLKNPFISRKEAVDDKFIVRISDGGKNWDESMRDVKFALEDSSGQVTDSFTLYMKKYNYHLVITGVKNGKIQYKLDKKKAVFGYTVVTDDESQSSYSVNRWVFISCSVVGLLALLYMFKKRKSTLAV